VKETALYEKMGFTVGHVTNYASNKRRMEVYEEADVSVFSSGAEQISRPTGMPSLRALRTRVQKCGRSDFSETTACERNAEDGTHAKH